MGALGTIVGEIMPTPNEFGCDPLAQEPIVFNQENPDSLHMGTSRFAIGQDRVQVYFERLRFRFLIASLTILENTYRVS